MKHIALWMGNGNNEPGWARILSTAGTVFLVRRGLTQQTSTWEKGQQTYQGPKERSGCWRWVDRLFFCQFSAFRLMRLTLKHTRGEPVALLIVDGTGGLLAMWLKRFGKARAVVSLHSDFLPAIGPWHVRWHRRVNTALNRFIASRADEVWRISPRIPIGEGQARNYVVPVYIDDNRIPLMERREIVYLGVPSKDHALDVLFDIARRHEIPLHIIGESPYLHLIKSSSPPQTKFHGYMTDPDQIAEIIRRCFCGYAIYRNTSPQNYSYYGVPSKSFHYLANNVPVLTTNTAFFSQYIEKNGVGRVIPPEPRLIEQAILEMRDHSQDFYHAINRFRAEWNRGVESFLAERMAVLLR